MEDWKEEETCFLSLEPQGTQKWLDLRIGAITMSKLSYLVGRGDPSFTDPPEEIAMEICGLKKKDFSEEQKINMQMGTDAEPHVRKWDELEKGVKIEEVGLGVWKKDPRFRGSMDGSIDKDDFVEYKVPKRMYWKLKNRMRMNPTPGDYSHIFPSHYDQMIGNGVIHGKKRCCYTVVSAENGEFYREWIPIDYEHWNNVLYPRAVEFYDTYVEPLMKKHGIKLVNPPGLTHVD